MTESPMQARVAKLENLRAKGIDPYPPRFYPSHSASRIVEQYSPLASEEHSGEDVTIAGRLTAMRQMGKAAFLDLRDGTGKVQVHAAIDNLGEQEYHDLCDSDIGDFLGVSGEVFRTKRGELTVAASRWKLISKSLRPLPEKWHGLRDVELRYRHRSLDLISNCEVREAFTRRSHMIAGMRRLLDSRGFLEVETPMMQPIAGGATARPFVTHHNALDIDLYLRVAPELYLKRLVVGGLERVYELAKNFRNEGVSTTHNPEFTTLEIYEAYADYEVMMSLAEEVVRAGVQAALGTTEISYQGNKIDLSVPWRRICLLDSVEQATGLSVSGLTKQEIEDQASAKGIEIPPLSRGKLIEHLFEKFVEPTLLAPTIVKDFPTEISPLAKPKVGQEGIVERFELYAGGMELANAFTELNDPLDQRRRFEAQEQLRAAGDDEAQRVDEDFLFSLEHGMPPTGGIGFGIDRLAMLVTDSRSIRDVILFPALRSRGET